MKKYLALYILVTILFSTNIFSQEKYSKFKFSGYRVHIIQSKNPAIVTKYDIKAIKEISNDSIFEMTIYDQTGSVPKDEVYVFTDKLEYLYLHNSILVLDDTLQTDSLTIIAGPAQANLKLDTKYFYINAGGGAQINISGKTDFFNCEVGAGSTIVAKDFVAKEADIDAMGYCSLIMNVEKVRNIKQENSSVRNVFK